jgi:hypothetical protein
MLGLEIHKNELTTNESDSLAIRGGYNFNNLFSDNYKVFLSGGLVEDKVKDKQSVQFISDVSFLSDDWHINTYWLGESSAFMWSPVAALELERVIDDPEDKTGNVARLMYGVAGQYAFWENKEDEYYRMVLDLSYSHWNNLSKDDSLALPDNHELMVANLRYVIDKEANNYEVAISYKYQKGEDVRNKIADNEFDQIGITVSFTFK